MTTQENSFIKSNTSSAVVGIKAGFASRITTRTDLKAVVVVSSITWAHVSRLVLSIGPGRKARSTGAA